MALQKLRFPLALLTWIASGSGRRAINPMRFQFLHFLLHPPPCFHVCVGLLDEINSVYRRILGAGLVPKSYSPRRDYNLIQRLASSVLEAVDSRRECQSGAESTTGTRASGGGFRRPESVLAQTMWRRSGGDILVLDVDVSCREAFTV
ncbi:hypothetical protein HGRIS_013910 [Hohenbuehelia grisea]|uniref:Secreted protein n=1 Tax=Hohenbuehelia grisea TaxID=104357 RepID=A0ABR3IX13_9AGAR